MATQKANVEGQLLAWGGAAGVGLLVFVLLLTLGGWGIIQALWMAVVAVLVVGAFNYFVFARPLPPLAGRAEPGAAAHRVAPEVTAPAPMVAADTAGPAETEPDAGADETRQ
jgi:hypothetical protein